MPAERYITATDDLLRGWVGPVIHDDEPAALIGPDPDYTNQWCISRPEGWEVMNTTTWCECVETEHIRLDPHRPEVIAHLARWLAEGERCPNCIEGRIGGLAPCSRPCATCSGSGHLRKPARVAHLLPKYLGGTLDTERAGDALAWSVRSVRAGGEVLRDIAGRWSPYGNRGEGRVGITSKNLIARVGGGLFYGWEVLCFSNPHGPETGADGRACADAAALRAGFALDNGDAVIWPPIQGESK